MGTWLCIDASCVLEICDILEHERRKGPWQHLFKGYLQHHGVVLEERENCSEVLGRLRKIAAV